MFELAVFELLEGEQIGQNFQTPEREELVVDQLKMVRQHRPLPREALRCRPQSLEPYSRYLAPENRLNAFVSARVTENQETQRIIRRRNITNVLFTMQTC